MKPLFEFSDYREYLREWVQARKEKGLPVSNRWIAQRMGINSTSWFTSILHGQKGMSRANAGKLSQILGHTGPERRFFETLVAFTQAKTLSQKNFLHAELTAIRTVKNAHVMSADQFEYYAVWYHSVVRSLIGMLPFRGDYQVLASMVVPAITPGQARQSIELLERLGLIKKGKTGYYDLSNTAVTTGEAVRSLAVANYQRETMRLADEAFERFPKANREISTVTVGISDDRFRQMRELLSDTRKRIAEIANADERADKVFQVNIQAFPLSRSRRERSGA